jgi:hypothetical protein
VDATNLYEFTIGEIGRAPIFLDRSETLKVVGLEE